MDNKIFNVNGKTKEQLKLALDLLILDEYGKIRKIKGWYINPKRGFVLTWFNSKGTTPFTNRIGLPEEISTTELIDILWNWLDSDAAKEIPLEEWEEKMEDSDVGIGNGWRLYTNEWGHVNNPDGHTIDHYSIGAIKKVYLWYGK